MSRRFKACVAHMSRKSLGADMTWRHLVERAASNAILKMWKLCKTDVYLLIGMRHDSQLR